MTKNEIQKYFKCRPGTDVLFSVNGIVFCDELAAATYADQFDLIVETHRCDDLDEPDGQDITGTTEETTEDSAESEATDKVEASDVQSGKKQKSKKQ